MTANNDKKYGRTFFDLIAEHPKPTFFIFLTILLIAIALIIFGIPFKVGNVQVGDNKPVLHDTIVKTKTDTQYKDQASYHYKISTRYKTNKRLNKKHIRKIG